MQQMAVLACVTAATSATATASPLFLDWKPGSWWTTVYNRSSMNCSDADTPDSMPIAWFSRQTNQTSLVTANSQGVFPMVGSTLDDLTRNCTRVVFNSTFDLSPASFANYQWLQSVHLFPNGSAFALIHNEFHGWEVPGNYCNLSGIELRAACNLWSTGLGISDDGGQTFHLARDPPAHRVASIPYQYQFDQPIAGYGAISDMLEGADGAYYGYVHVSGKYAQLSGNCPIRTQNPWDPASFRAWDGSSYRVEFADPYVSPAPNATLHLCTPLPGPDNVTSEHPSPRRILWDSSIPIKTASSPPFAQGGLPNFVMAGDGIGSEGTFAYRFSYGQDFATAGLEWTNPQLLDTGLRRYAPQSGIIYPTILDHNSPGLGSDNFAFVSNDTGYIYVNMRRSIYRRPFIFTPNKPAPPPPLPPAPPADCKSFKVTEAGTGAANGLYSENGQMSDNEPVFENPAGTQIYRFEGNWRIGVMNVGVLYEPEQPTGARPAVGDWRIIEGEAPAPLYVACADSE